MNNLDLYRIISLPNKKIIARITFFFFLLTVMYTNSLLSQDKSVPVVPLETWANNQHQPEKLMGREVVVSVTNG